MWAYCRLFSTIHKVLIETEITVNDSEVATASDGKP